MSGAAAPAVPHAARVARLYRQALKQTLSWAVQRELFYEQARELRSKFEASRHMDSVQGARLVEQGEARLEAQQHPDPYTVPYTFGGSLYARNPPVPESVNVHLDFGREGYDQS